ncbi:MAG: hypothetical protein PHX74_08510 [Candidatus Sumerlaeales bacterium]|nr:hypothetical protein [Candidatus Sumerlaeales bacterium]
MSLRLDMLRTASVLFAALSVLILSESSSQAVIVEPLDLLQCEYRENGSSEAEAVSNADLRAVRAGVGRLLCSDYGLQARELLTPYLEINAKKYVSSNMVLDRRVDRNCTGVFVRVLVATEKLMRDLREKNFLYKPSPVPSMALFINQLAEDHTIESTEARGFAEKSILEQGGRVAKMEVPGLSQNSFALLDAGTAAQALETASHAGAEVVLTAVVQTGKVGEKEVLFDPMTTYETTVTMIAFRKDDGTVTGKSEHVERATDKVAETARARSVELAVTSAAAAVTLDTMKAWKAHYQNGANFNVLLTYADKTQTAEFKRHLEMTMGRGTRAYLKSWYGDVAVFSVVTPCGYETLESAINSCTIGNMRITNRTGKRIIVEPSY